ncbi:hypothetical protein [Pelagicoccus sp. SDUM812002]|nr:hypothetical protein [Pelagicoccus sp. SDUM812002]MDQ8184685.1 hypothetical protein [Pelagicoccus sp. SDUM812002]
MVLVVACIQGGAAALGQAVDPLLKLFILCGVDLLLAKVGGRLISVP